jgi:hypothetical protein
MTSILLAILLSGIATPASNAVDRTLEAPKRVLLVKDYKWASGGMGRPAIMKEITLQNVGKYDYENISIEVDLYTKNDIPLGSLRGTIHDILPHGSEKTFYNVKFGIMSAELQNTTPAARRPHRERHQLRQRTSSSEGVGMDGTVRHGRGPKEHNPREQEQRQLEGY